LDRLIQNIGDTGRPAAATREAVTDALQSAVRQAISTVSRLSDRAKDNIAIKLGAKNPSDAEFTRVIREWTIREVSRRWTAGA
jgi:hypothetical protein